LINKTKPKIILFAKQLRRNQKNYHAPSQWIHQKLGLDLGHILSLTPISRGPSGRIKLLKITGKKGEIRIGKELEIRRILSSSHLYSSAFIVETEGPLENPEAFLLTGAGWGHGVGLCQIGAAVMAYQGLSYEDILEHYYPGTQREIFYS